MSLPAVIALEPSASLHRAPAIRWVRARHRRRSKRFSPSSVALAFATAS